VAGIEEPTRAGFVGGVAETMDSMRALVGSEAGDFDVSERYDCVMIWKKRSSPSSSYPGRCSPGNKLRVRI
jgi:hypothetical protein